VDEDLRPRRRSLAEQLRRPLGDQRVHDGVEPGQRRRVGEDALGECRPVEAAVRLYQLVTEGVGHGAQPRRPDVDDLPAIRSASTTSAP
jgi:hypothetical protein